ncbi:uncharacterized protein LOC134285379 [Aedes albopictus]
MKCFVPTCRSEFTRNSKKNGWKSKHRFPKNTAQRYGWLQAIANAENITINVESINFRTARVCSEHFTDSSFCFRKSKRFLTDEAVPTVFQSNKENCSEFLVSELAGSVTTQQLDSGPVSDTHQDHRRSGFGSIQRTFNVGADQLLPQHRTLRSPISNNLEHHHSIKHHNNNLLDASTKTANTDESGASAPTAQNKVGTENGNRRR